MTAVSVIIPTCQQRFLASTLNGLTKQTNKNFEVIVVENGGDFEATDRLVQKFVPRIELSLCQSYPIGLNIARNKGVACSRFEIIAFIDDDCVPNERWIEQIVAGFEGNPDAVVVGGKISLEFLTTPAKWVSQFESLLSIIEWGPQMHELGKGEWLAGANLCFSKDVLDKVSGFNCEIGMRGRGWPQLGNDELECIERIKKAGLGKIYFNPKAEVKHIIPQDRLSPQYLESRSYGQGQSDYELLSIGQKPSEHERIVIGKLVHYRDTLWACARESVQNQEFSYAEKFIILRVYLARFTGLLDGYRFQNSVDCNPYGLGNGYHKGRNRVPSSESLQLHRLCGLLVRVMYWNPSKKRPAQQYTMCYWVYRIDLMNGMVDGILNRDRTAYLRKAAPDSLSSDL